MAAAYAYYLTLNHPFVDGNKRVGWSCLRTFLFREGFELVAPAAEAVQVMLNVAAGTMTKEALEKWGEENARARPSLELRDFFVSLSYHELQSKLVAIAQSYISGGPEELTAIVREAANAIPCLDQLAFLYQTRREDNEQAIHYIQLLAAIYRIAEEQGYAW